MAAAVGSGLAGGGLKEGASHEDWKKLSDDVSRISLSEENHPSEANQGEEKRESDDEDKRILELLELFFSTPEFTDAVRLFVEDNEDKFVYVEEGEEQPLSNYDLYLKYTNMIESQLESFLKQHDVDHEDVARLCVNEKAGGNRVSFSLDFIIASTEYDKFLQMMADFKSMRDFEIGDDDDLLGWGLGGEVGEAEEDA